MKIVVYCICRNEARMMPYFLRHYGQFADVIYCYDDESTDGTRELILAHPKAILENWEGTHGIVDDEFMKFNTEQYKMQRGWADWIMIVDVDEFIYHPDITKLLQEYLNEGVEVPLVTGYNMVAYKFPTTDGQIYDEIKTGYQSPIYSKPVVFQCSTDMKWHHGRHQLAEGFNPKRSTQAELKLLHYRYIDPDYVKERNLNNWNRMPQANRAAGYGWTCNPEWHGEHSYDWYMGINPLHLYNVVSA